MRAKARPQTHGRCNHGKDIEAGKQEAMNQFFNSEAKKPGGVAAIGGSQGSRADSISLRDRTGAFHPLTFWLLNSTGLD
jgi:hypothetical protein